MKIDINIKYHERQMPQGKMEDMLNTLLKSLGVYEKVVSLIMVMNSSYACQGFELDDDDSLYGVPLKPF